MNVLVLCTGNSCRSQMMHGYLEAIAPGKANYYSAGIKVHGVNPRAIKVMNEDGVDISKHTSNDIDDYRHVEFDIVLTVCDHARENCPWFPGKTLSIHQSFEDPAKAAGTDDEILDKFRVVRDQIKEYASVFVNNHLQ